MQIIRTVKEIRSIINHSRFFEKKQIGFVPTMGSLHQGHLSLIETANSENDISVCSIFINPTQFNNPSDFDLYPKDFDKDIELLTQAGCNILFLPETTEMYPNEVSTSFDFGDLGNQMEGKFRPGHFNGVGVVLSKLFHTVPANRAYFGQKDLQQYSIVKQFVNELFFDIEIKVCSIFREKNGLAMSSRNERLSPSAKDEAKILYQILQKCSSLLKEGKTLSEVKTTGIDLLNKHPNFTLEYLSIVNTQTLKEIEETKNVKEIAICIAAFVEEVRLIDNIIIE